MDFKPAYFVVEDDIEVPALGCPPKYPFRKMAVGQSFAFPEAELRRVRAAAFSASKSSPPMKFRVSGLHLRCWRIK